MRLAEHAWRRTIIAAPGLYRTRCGELVTINSLVGYWRSYGVYPDGTREMWDVSGRLLPWSLSKNDVVARVT